VVTAPSLSVEAVPSNVQASSVHTALNAGTGGALGATDRLVLAVPPRSSVTVSVTVRVPPVV